MHILHPIGLFFINEFFRTRARLRCFSYEIFIGRDKDILGLRVEDLSFSAGEFFFILIFCLHRGKDASGDLNSDRFFFSGEKILISPTRSIRI